MWCVKLLIDTNPFLLLLSVLVSGTVVSLFTLDSVLNGTSTPLLLTIHSAVLDPHTLIGSSLTFSVTTLPIIRKVAHRLPLPVAVAPSSAPLLTLVTCVTMVVPFPTVIVVLILLLCMARNVAQHLSGPHTPH